MIETLIEEIGSLHESRWEHRKRINSRPTTKKGESDNHFTGIEADYYFLGDLRQPKAFNQYLRSLAPKLKGYILDEAIINRYEVGQGMAEHIDLDNHRVNMTIPLMEEGDGLFVNGVWHEDVKGRACCFQSPSPPHYVPPVKHKRYLVVYLYC